MKNGNIEAHAFDNLGVINETSGCNGDDATDDNTQTQLSTNDPDRKVKKQVSISINVTNVDEESPKDEKETGSALLYRVSESPPIFLTILFGFQQCVLSLVGSLIIPFMVADIVCGADNTDLTTKLISSTMVMNGITTLIQTIFGIRLPLFQGPAPSYVIPLLALKETQPDRCSLPVTFPDKFINGSMVNTTTQGELENELQLLRLSELVLPLAVCGLFQFLTGFTGLVGYLSRFIGPITIVPTLFLVGLYIVGSVTVYVEVHWGIAILTWAVGIFLSLYVGHKPMPIPIYRPKKGWKIVKYPVHQVFSVLISILVGWLVCGILTASGALTDDPNDIQYKTRTDARSQSISTAPWFNVPYPGQFGVSGFAVNAFIGFVVGTFTSILDSIGDYYACAAVCRVPNPPGHAVNRGIAAEGFGSIISAFMGIGHATSTYGGNIGAIGLTKVASRQVFVALGAIYVVLGLFSKVSAIFVSIPYPVLGGILLTIIAVFIGVNLSNLQGVDLSSTRNLTIIGLGIFAGFLVPAWLTKNPKIVLTGHEGVDEVLRILLGNPNFVGTALACFLDNTVPGTPEERGIAAWQDDGPSDDVFTSAADVDENTLTEGPEVYDPVLPARWRNHKIFKYLPIFPYKEDTKESKFDLQRRQSSVLMNDVISAFDHDMRRMSLPVGEASRRQSLLLVARRQSMITARRKSVFAEF